MLQGEPPTWPEFDRPADLVDVDPVTWWQAKAAAARRALAGADLDLEMDTPMGPRTVADRPAFPAIDRFVHAWDIGRATGIDVEIPGGAIAFAHTTLDPFPDEVQRGPNGALGAAVAAPADATPTEAFIAWTGRQPR